MKDFTYLLENFFTHKDFLVPAEQIPGTLFTPLHFVFSAVLLAVIILSAIHVAKHKHLIKPVLLTIWIIMLVWEFVIVTWESVAGKEVALDLKSNLSLYPCSIYLFALPFAMLGKGNVKKSACGYLCTLGLMGASINFFYPAIRLSTYSCISFIGFHTFLFHGSMLFTCLVLLISGYHRYTHVTKWQELFLPCIASLLMSVPANIVNYTIGADYMFFRGDFPIVHAIFGDTPRVIITLVMYALYIFIPALYYLPSFLRNRKNAKVLSAC